MDSAAGWITHKPEFSSAAASRQQVCAAGFFTAPLKQDNVVPDTADTAITFAEPDLAEPAFAMQGTATCVARNDLRLQCPVTIGFRGGNQPVQQRRPDPLPLCL